MARLEGRWAVGDEGRASLGDAVGEGELEVRDEELPDVGAADILGLLNLNHTEDVDRPEAGTVASSHVLVEGLDGIRTSELTELLVHVVGAGARVIAEPDAEVLDLQGLLLVDNVDTDNLARGLLDLLELTQEVPEPRLGHNFVGREDAHAVDLGAGISLSGEVAADDLEFLERHFGESYP